MALTADPQPHLPVARRHVLATWGIATEDLDRRVGQMGLLDAGVRAEVLGDDGRTVRLALVAEDHDRLEWGVGVVRAGLGDLVLGDDGVTIEGQVVELLRRQGLTAGTAESLTSGGVAERLSEPPGSSEVFHGGIVAYTVAVKHRVLDVPVGPVVSADAAMAMAEGAARLLGVDVAVAATGVAGPAEMEGQRVGTVFIGSWLDGEARSLRLLLDGSRDRIRRASASHALDHLRHRLLARERRRPPRPSSA